MYYSMGSSTKIFTLVIAPFSFFQLILSVSLLWCQIVGELRKSQTRISTVLWCLQSYQEALLQSQFILYFGL